MCAIILHVGFLGGLFFVGFFCFDGGKEGWREGEKERRESVRREGGRELIYSAKFTLCTASDSSALHKHTCKLVLLQKV